MTGINMLLAVAVVYIFGNMIKREGKAPCEDGWH